jgi:hypothetical protein
LSAKGQIIDAQSVIQPANGQDPLQWYKETLRYVVSPSEISGAQADVKVPYVITDLAGGHAMITFYQV